jgi:hypothetical protein
LCVTPPTAQAQKFVIESLLLEEHQQEQKNIKLKTKCDMEQNNIFNDFNSETYDKVLSFIYDETIIKGHSVSGLSVESLLPELSDFQIKQLIDNIFYFRKGLLIYEFQNSLYENAFPVNTVPTYIKPGGVAKRFIENGGFKKVYQDLTEESAKAEKKEKLNQDALMASIKSEKHARRSTWATWIASIAAVFSILLSVYFSNQSNNDLEKLKVKIENLEKKHTISNLKKLLPDSGTIKTNRTAPATR